jgi:uncharacterized protein (TIGR02001 family)
VLRWLLALLTGPLATAAAAQVSFNAAVVSDNRFRGVSLSDGKPAIQLSASYDHHSGIYAGLFGSSVEFDPGSGREAQMTGYAGYVRRLNGSLSADAGVAYSNFSGGENYNYLEWHAGLTSRALAARLYYAANYFGQDIHTLYGELNASHRLGDHWNLVAHAGVLKAVGSMPQPPPDNGNAHPDFLAGFEYGAQPWRLQLSRVFNDRSNRIYPLNPDHLGGVWAARISVSF